MEEDDEKNNPANLLAEKMAQRRAELEVIKEKIIAKVRELAESENDVGLASAPHLRVTRLIQSYKDMYPVFFFHPDTDFKQFGVGPLNSAHWLFCWGLIGDLAGWKGGTVYFMKHVSGMFEGSQQSGELDRALSIPGLKIIEVLYDDQGDFVSEVILNRTRTASFFDSGHYLVGSMDEKDIGELPDEQDSDEGEAVEASGTTTESSAEVESLKQEIDALKCAQQIYKQEICKMHEQNCSMLPFMKIEASALVEQSLGDIVKKGWDHVHWKDGYTLLHYVAETVEDPLVVQLVGQFATNVDDRDSVDMRPIDYARLSGRKDVVKVIQCLRRQRRLSSCSKKELDNTRLEIQRLKCTAFRPRERAKSSGEPMQASSSEPSKEEVQNVGNRQELEQRLEDMTSLQPNLRKALKAVLDVGWEKVIWPSNFTGMHLAAKLGNVDAVDWLVRAKAELTVTDEWGLTPLDYAVQGGKQDAIDFVMGQLRQAQGSQELDDGKFCGGREPTPQMPLDEILAKQRGSHSGRPREPRKEQRRQLEVPGGLRPELEKACQAVLRNGWPKIKWPKDFSALHLAARMGSADAINLLIEATAWPGLYVRDSLGMRPLDYAFSKKHTHIYEILQPDDTNPHYRKETDSKEDAGPSH